MPGICGCGVSDVDSDSDGTADCNDNCPHDMNKVNYSLLVILKIKFILPDRSSQEFAVVV